MKSIKELEEIRKKAQENMNIRGDSSQQIRVLVGMSTCGIAAGARKTLLSIVEEVNKRKLNNTVIAQTGCIGLCKFEPLVDVILPNQEKFTYVNIDEEKAKRIVTEHIVNGNPCKDLLIKNN